MGFGMLFAVKLFKFRKLHLKVMLLKQRVILYIILNLNQRLITLFFNHIYEYQ